MLDGRGRLDWFYLKCSTDVGKRRGAKGQALGVMGLPALVFSSQIERARVLQVRRQDYGLVAGLAGKLYTEVPAVKGYEGKLEVLGQ